MRFLTVMIIIFSFMQVSCAQKIGEFTVKGSGESAISTLAVPLENFSINPENGQILLYDKETDKMVPSQLEQGVVNRLWFVFDHKNGEKTYEIRQKKNSRADAPKLEIQTNDTVSNIYQDGNKVLTYYHEEKLPPAGADPNYRRSGFIHPLLSPQQQVLTNIQPPDHMHHYGIWNPWTNTTFTYDGQEYDVDFWNLHKGEGRVRFGGYLNKQEGDVYTGLQIRHEHIAYPEKDQEREILALTELWDVRVWNIPGSKVRVVDLTTTLNTPLPNGILMNQHRYGGGFGYRAPEHWVGSTSSVLTSEGKTRNETDDTKARWCRIEGETSSEEGRSGIVVLSHPSNRQHPEPMRMWNDESGGGSGQIFFQFTPIRHEDWKMESGQNYVLRYRMILFDGELTPEEAEIYWRGFASAPAVVVHQRY